MTQEEIDIHTQIEHTGEARFYPVSSSMRPTISPNKDVCIIGPLPRKHLRYGTLVLYRRKNGMLTVNRVIHRGSKTHAYRLCGDNRNRQERGITRSQMVGTVTAIENRKTGTRRKTKSLPMILWTILMLIRTWLAVNWHERIQSPAATIYNEMTAPLRSIRFRRHRHHHHHEQGQSGEQTTTHHQHHHHTTYHGATSRHPYQVGRGVWLDIVHAFKKTLPQNKKRYGSVSVHEGHRKKKKHTYHGPWWKRFLHRLDPRRLYHRHHHHTSRYATEWKWLTQRRGEIFFMGLRLPWVPQYILKKYGFRHIKKANNNLLTSLDWTIPTNEFQMPYNLPMQTLSFIVFVILLIKIILAIGWLIFFLLYGNENSSRVYMYNLLITATWYPVALFFIAYYYHLNKIIFMSIQRISLMAAFVSLFRTAIFVYKVIGSFQINLVTVFNMMEIVCWICISGFFFIMHYKLTGREDFIPRFWLTKAQKERRRQRIQAKSHARHEKRKQEIRQEYDHRQGTHIEH